MSEPRRAVCGTHGETPATFTCRHVAEGVACGFHASAEDPAEPWPDAWCDLCEEAFQAEGGEWNDVSEAQADVQLLCTHCYEAARARNRDLPRHAAGAAARLTEDEASRLIRHAVDEARAGQAASRERWGWGEMARWDYDEAGTLTFSDPARPSVVADVQLVGSYSTNTGTFQWAWETLDDGDPTGAAIARLRVFGEVRGVAGLTTACRECELAEAWEMAALARYLLGGEAIYRAPFDHLYWFMLLSSCRTAT